MSAIFFLFVIKTFFWRNTLFLFIRKKRGHHFRKMFASGRLNIPFILVFPVVYLCWFLVLYFPECVDKRGDRRDTVLTRVYTRTYRDIHAHAHTVTYKSKSFQASASRNEQDKLDALPPSTFFFLFFERSHKMSHIQQRWATHKVHSKHALE